MDKIGKVDVISMVSRVWCESSACMGYKPWELIPTQFKGAYKNQIKA